MRVHHSSVGWVAHAPAKLNLFFEVSGKRDDGYHEIETLMVPVDLYDTLCFQEQQSGRIQFQCRQAFPTGRTDDSHSGDVPTGDENLVVRAIELLRSRAGVGRGAAVQLIKRIPSAAGLGGGSSDAAAALVLANRGWNLHWPLEALAPLAAELGSDIPFFLVGGPAMCRGRGEQVEPIDAVGALSFVIVRPPVGLSTAAVYRACRVPERPRSPGPLLTSLSRGDVAVAGRSMVNRLQPAAETLSPWIRKTREEVARCDLPGHQMSGSGSCYFGLCRHARHARRVASRLRASGIGTVFTVQRSR